MLGDQTNIESPRDGVTSRREDPKVTGPGIDHRKSTGERKRTQADSTRTGGRGLSRIER